jgi:hypothetical protein
VSANGRGREGTAERLNSRDERIIRSPAFRVSECHVEASFAEDPVLGSCSHNLGIPGVRDDRRPLIELSPRRADLRDRCVLQKPLPDPFAFRD